jgi:hypothetical protein
MSDIQDLKEQLRADPNLLYSIDPRRFEELVAELLAGQGYQVQITPPTRDGGYDILAARKDPLGLETTTVVECKRYAPDRSVGISQVRELYGVKTFLGVSNAVLVTSSGFTKDANRFVEGKYDVQLIDATHLFQWIGSYRPPSTATSFVQQRRFYSTFISHSSRDIEFVEALNSALRDAGIKVWYAPEDLVPGEKLRDQIKRAIRSFDKLILVLSTNSMTSNWVATETRDAIKRETDEGKQVLFPIAVAPMDEIRAWECFDSDTGRDMAVEVRQYYIPDFVNWKNDVVFEKQFGRLLKGLTAHDHASTKIIYPASRAEKLESTN